MKLELPIKYHIKIISLDELFETYAYEEVLGYCQQCSNYLKNHSCPEFEFTTKQLLESYKHATLILTQINTTPIKNHWDRIKNQHFESRVAKVQQKFMDEHEVRSEIAMYCFNEVKDKIADVLLEAEKLTEGFSSTPGSCTRCEECTKAKGEPCIFEDKLRYSLEALGFKVGEIYERFFNLELEWTKDQLPKNYHTCSCLFTKESPDYNKLEILLKEQLNAITLL